MDDAVRNLINGAVYGGIGIIVTLVCWFGYLYWLKHYGWK